jgi:ADP-ribose pyrophosphatase YjhB (NUDIX family)
MVENTGIRLRAALIAFDDRGRILLVRHVRPSDTYWVLPGGGVESGETIEKALEREVEEELGVRCEIERLQAVGELIYGQRHVVDFFLSGRLERNDGLKVRHEEGIAEMAWVEPDELGSKRVLPPEIIPVIETALKREMSAAIYLGKYKI